MRDAHRLLGHDSWAGSLARWICAYYYVGYSNAHILDVCFALIIHASTKTQFEKDTNEPV